MSIAIQHHKKRKATLYTCFVDFAKAFDSVNHGLLWSKLASMGLSGRMLKILQSMYGKATSRVVANGTMSPTFHCSKGVRQGCNLSPLLFSLFISDLESHLSANNSGSIHLGSKKAHLLLFADDLALLADSHSGLQTSIDLLEEYCLTWDLKINIDKTKTIAFNNKKGGPHFTLSSSPLEATNEYKYLGIVLSDTGSLRPAILTLANQTRKACFSLLKSLSHLSHPDPPLQCYLFDSLVRPVAEYGCEIWGYARAEELEVIHQRFCKSALGVPITTTNLDCYGELGRSPLIIKRKVLMVKYWLRVAGSWDVPPLVKEAYTLAKNHSLQWTSYVKQILDESGYSYVWSHPSSVNPHAFANELKQRLEDQYIQAWSSELQANTGKLRTYKLIKHDFKMEKYLNLPPHLRVPTARLRTSAHSLRIETGRYNFPTPIPAEERFCWFCSNQLVEDELHFLFDCDLYKSMPEKDKLIEHCSSVNHSFAFLSNLEKFKFISFAEQPKTIFLFCKFVAAALETRKSTVHIID